MSLLDRAADLVGMEPTAFGAVALVTLLVVLRGYYGSVLLSLRFLTLWGALRQRFMPLVDRVAKEAVGIPAENKAVKAEYVSTFDRSPKEVAEMLQRGSDRKLEVSVLSGYKTDWHGNPEVASVVGYHGAKPFPGAPHWLRREQVHVTMFRGRDGGTVVTAHKEANSWRPDLWRDHLFKGDTFDAAKGVQTAAAWLAAARAD